MKMYNFRRLIKNCFYKYNSNDETINEHNESVSKLDDVIIKPSIGRRGIEKFLMSLTCQELQNQSGQIYPIFWKAVLAIDNQPFATVQPAGNNRYHYQNLLNSELTDSLEKIRKLELAANEYLQVSKNGLDLLIHRLFPDQPEYRLTDDKWIAYNGLDAANKILNSRRARNDSLIQKKKPSVKEGFS